jgi:hypothetical protein
MSTNNGSHSGGDKNFWRKSRVDNYDSIQTTVVGEQYFCGSEVIHARTILSSAVPFR